MRDKSKSHEKYNQQSSTDSQQSGGKWMQNIYNPVNKGSIR